MAKCNQLISLPFKGLNRNLTSVQIPEERAFVERKKRGVVVEMAQVDLASTDDYRYAGAEVLDFGEPVFVDAAQ